MELVFILVEPARPENVGAAARAMKTMGFSRMRLVNPCDHLDDRALRVAHASQEILKDAEVYSSFEDAVADLDFIVGTSAKKRVVKVDYYQSTELVSILERKKESVARAGVVFGREESGLTNEELQRCSIATTIFMRSRYPSLNLGQAVMLYAYTLSPLALGEPAKRKSEQNSEGFAVLKGKVEVLMGKLDVDQHPLLYNRILERMGLLDDTDIHLLHSICNRLLEKL